MRQNPKGRGRMKRGAGVVGEEEAVIAAGHVVEVGDVVEGSEHTSLHTVVCQKQQQKGVYSSVRISPLRCVKNCQFCVPSTFLC